MATRTITTHTDDIDGSEGARNVRFSLDGSHYEIDLSEEHAEALREALGQFIGHGRRISTTETGGPRARRATTAAAGTSSSSAGRDYDPKVVRRWAAEHAVGVSPGPRQSDEYGA